MSEEGKRNPEFPQLEQFIKWLKEDWAHIALVAMIILFIIAYTDSHLPLK